MFMLCAKIIPIHSFSCEISHAQKTGDGLEKRRPECTGKAKKEATIEIYASNLRLRKQQ